MNKPSMGHEVEYDEAMVKMLELTWGEGFMAPGGKMHSLARD